MKNSEKGSIAMESAIVLPILLILILVIVSTTSTVIETKTVSQALAEESARSASQRSSESKAYSSAKQTVTESALNNNVQCFIVDLNMDLSPGGSVQVTVTCTGETQILPGFPSQKISKSSTAIEVVDRYRS